MFERTVLWATVLVGGLWVAGLLTDAADGFTERHGAAFASALSLGQGS